ncbi:MULTISPECIES: HAMP domain-containing sensor histidine kinase [unclassified Leifsonia]|uniref:sensor histidine kinase n=1 Tax=unclassified Leifsonia TaxID=2663824 RepID=UPI0008A75464|nr:MULTISPECIES: HAMP domain-containing sensor histidine kinase [unclassified Leifsonia]SEI11886.1 two-component system, OmpR family, sensor histidine kinase VanS [Leifsonia sp. CL154]SFL94705.1 two-component system, OmpR family, sensor histidine kinase VanS [Leifsonia sp. CL147]
MDRRPGLSVRLKLTISYAAFLLVAGSLLLLVVWLFLLRYVPANALELPEGALHGRPGPFFPGRDDLVRAFAPAAEWAMMALLVIGVFGGWILAGRMLAPLAKIAGATRSVAGGALSHRIRLEGRSDEFRELADSFDAMLAQLEAHDAEQRRFAANASHELRTPLAITQTLLDVARSDPDSDTADLLERLTVVNRRAIELTQALLLLSRVEQGTFERDVVDLSLLAEEAVETMMPLAEKHHVSIRSAGELSLAVGSHPLLLQLTTNLVHNAIIHNRPDGRVEVSTAAEGGLAVLTVENTGDLVDPRLLATLTEPFQRGSQRIRSDHAGVGLGLAIVKSIAQAHSGSLTLTSRPGGGLSAAVRLPRAS